MTYDALWNPIKIGDMELDNRLFMSPMTRNRSNAAGVPNELNAEYYAQRAGNGLLISEGTQPSLLGQGYMLTPGIHTDEQVAGWRQTVDAVHGRGGRIFIQLMHVGRVSHPDNTLHGEQPVAPSEVAAPGDMPTANGMLPMPTPRELSHEEVRETISDFAEAAAMAIEAGADGVEVHGGYGYLVHQFLGSNTNLRTDEFGGGVENRTRFAVEVVRAIAERIGAGRVGIRISPNNPYNGVSETDTRDLYLYLAARLSELDIAYLHYVAIDDEELLRDVRGTFDGPLVLNRPGADLAARAKDVADGVADAITVGALSLANPDLVERLRAGAPLNEPDPSTFYGGDRIGYTTYPTLQKSESLS